MLEVDSDKETFLCRSGWLNTLEKSSSLPFHSDGSNKPTRLSPCPSVDELDSPSSWFMKFQDFLAMLSVFALISLSRSLYLDLL